MQQQQQMTMARRPRRTTAQAKRERAAYHEAGHAVVAMLYGIQVDEISMAPCGDARALVKTQADPDVIAVANGCAETIPPTDESRAVIQVLLAGPIAAALHEGRRTSTLITIGFEGASDHEQAMRLASVLFEDPAGMIEVEERETRDMLKDPAVWLQVEALATVLTQPGIVLSRTEVHEIVAVPAGRRAA